MTLEITSPTHSSSPELIFTSSPFSKPFTILLDPIYTTSPDLWRSNSLGPSLADWSEPTTLSAHDLPQPSVIIFSTPHAFTHRTTEGMLRAYNWDIPRTRVLGPQSLGLPHWFPKDAFGALSPIVPRIIPIDGSSRLEVEALPCQSLGFKFWYRRGYATGYSCISLLYARNPVRAGDINPWLYTLRPSGYVMDGITRPLLVPWCAPEIFYEPPTEARFEGSLDVIIMPWVIRRELVRRRVLGVDLLKVVNVGVWINTERVFSMRARTGTWPRVTTVEYRPDAIEMAARLTAAKVAVANRDGWGLRVVESLARDEVIIGELGE